MANWTNLATTDGYAALIAAINDRDLDAAKGFDPAVVTVTVPATNTVRWNSANKYWEKYNGTTWAALAAAYSININGTVGATTPASGAFTTLSAGATTIAGGVVNTSGRSTFAATSEPFGLGAKYTAAGGTVYFGATDATGTPGGQISNAGGTSTMSWTYGGAITIPGTLGVTGLLTATGGIAVEAVIAPTLINSWANVGGSSATAGYYKNALGVVRLRGEIQTGANGSIAFTLPAGYLPPATQSFACYANALFGYVTINSTGSVSAFRGSNATIDLSTITFRAA